MFGTEQPMSDAHSNDAELFLGLNSGPNSACSGPRVPAHDLMRGPNNQVRSVRLAHHAQVVPYILTRMLRVTSIDEVLSHAARRIRSKPGTWWFGLYWMAVALTRRVVGLRYWAAPGVKGR